MTEPAIVEPPQPSGASPVVPAPAAPRDDSRVPDRSAARPPGRATAVPAQAGAAQRAGGAGATAPGRASGRPGRGGGSGAVDAAVTAAAWDEALAAAAELRAALAGIGLDEPFVRMRGDVNVYGTAMVSLGRVTPTAARQLAAVLRGFGVTAGDEAP